MELGVGLEVPPARVLLGLVQPEEQVRGVLLVAVELVLVIVVAVAVVVVVMVDTGVVVVHASQCA